MSPSLRPYSRDDRDACLGVFSSNVPRYFRDHERQEFEVFIDAANAPYFVMEDSGTVVGCGGYAMGDNSTVADLCWGMIDMRHHGKRLGEFLLLGRLYAIAQHEQITGVRLGTCQLTDGFFLRYGFEVRSRQPDAIAAGLDTVEMYLDLSEQVRRRIFEGGQVLTRHSGESV